MVFHANSHSKTLGNGILGHLIWYINIWSKQDCVCAKSLQSCPTLWTVAHQAPLSMGFSSQKCWRGCHFLLQGGRRDSIPGDCLEQESLHKIVLSILRKCQLWLSWRNPLADFIELEYDQMVLFPVPESLQWCSLLKLFGGNWATFHSG